MKPQNLINLKQLLKNEQWEDINNCADINERFKIFLSKFNNHLDNVCPYKTYVKDHRDRNKGWITKGILTSRRNLQNYSKINKYSTDLNSKMYYNNYKRIYKKVIRMAKAKEVNRKIKTSKNISKTAWEIINENKPMHSKPCVEIIIKNKKICDSKDIAEHFNNFFANVASSSKIVQADENIDIPMCTKYNVSSMFLYPISEHYIISVINKLPAKNQMIYMAYQFGF